MKLDITEISTSFNQAMPIEIVGINIKSVLNLCNIASSTWRKYHLKIRQAEDYLTANNKVNAKPLGFTYSRRSKALDRRSCFIIYAFCYLQRFFSDENLSLKLLYKYWEKIECQVNL